MGVERVVRRGPDCGQREPAVLASAIAAAPEQIGGLDWVLAEVVVMPWPPAEAGHGEAPTWT